MRSSSFASREGDPDPPEVTPPPDAPRPDRPAEVPPTPDPPERREGPMVPDAPGPPEAPPPDPAGRGRADG